MEMEGYCFKDRKKIDITAGCCHPKDYCPDRTSCMVYFLEQEQKREAAQEQIEDSIEQEERNANTTHQ
jgi:hypothetical protein